MSNKFEIGIFPPNSEDSESARKEKNKPVEMKDFDNFGKRFQ